MHLHVRDGGILQRPDTRPISEQARFFFRLSNPISSMSFRLSRLDAAREARRAILSLTYQ